MTKFKLKVFLKVAYELNTCFVPDLYHCSPFILMGITSKETNNSSYFYFLFYGDFNYHNRFHNNVSSNERLRKKFIAFPKTYN